MENWKDIATKELNDISKECSEENWGNAMEVAVAECVALSAQKLLAMIPPSFPKPDICPKHDGGIRFEWNKTRGPLFLISVADDNVIYYSGLFGKHSKVHGTEPLYDSLPSFIITCLERVFNNT